MILDWIIAIIAGAIIGWVASMVMRTDRSQSLFANIVIGIVGAALGRWFFGSFLGIGSAASAGALSLLGLLWGVIGAVIIIAIIRAIWPGSLITDEERKEYTKGYAHEFREREKEKEKEKKQNDDEDDY